MFFKLHFYYTKESFSQTESSCETYSSSDSYIVSTGMTFRHQFSGSRCHGKFTDIGISYSGL